MSLVNCDKVYVKKCANGVGVFAKNIIYTGELIETGIVRRVDTDGHKNPYLFTWSEDRTIWAFGSGCSLVHFSTNAESELSGVCFNLTLTDDLL